MASKRKNPTGDRLYTGVCDTCQRFLVGRSMIVDHARERHVVRLLRKPSTAPNRIEKLKKHLQLAQHHVLMLEKEAQ